MPCKKCSNGKYKFGDKGECKHTKAKCREIERAYYAKKKKGKKE